jgi:hypothetical protein
MSSPGPTPIVGYSRERVCADGSVLVSHNQIALLNGLFDRPNGVAESYADLARASLTHLARFRSEPRRNALLGSIPRLPSAWVTRRRCGRRVECTLTARGKAIVNCEVRARITGEGPYAGLRSRPNLLAAAKRRDYFGADLTPLRLPPHVQDLVDAAVEGLGSVSYVDRHPAFDQLTSWLEVGDRVHAFLSDTRTWRRTITPARLGELAAASYPISQPTPREQIDHLRATLVALIASDADVVEPGVTVHVVLPLRASNGTYAVLGAHPADCVEPTSLMWEGLFRSSDGFRHWLCEERGLITSLRDFASLAHVDQLAIWGGTG